MPSVRKPRAQRGRVEVRENAARKARRYVVEGRLIIDLDGEGGRTVELTPRQGFVVPKGVVHRTRALERTVMLMVEGAGIVPTGD